MPNNLDFPPRDLVGFGATPPQVEWPGGARVAVNFCINYEEGAEMCVVNGDDRSEVRLSNQNVKPRVGARDLNIESDYEYGSRAGFWRIMRAFRDRGLPATVNLVGLAGELNPRALEAIAESGFDVQPHGWRWIDYHGMSADEERALIAKCVAQVERITGEHPLGYYAGLPSENTRRLVVEEGGFLYDSDCYNDDLPYWTHDHGKPHLVLPYSLDTNDSRFTLGLGYMVAEQFATYIRNSLHCLHVEGESHPKMMTIGLHARLIGRPGRIAALHAILDDMAGDNAVWVCRRGDLARHWAENYPPYTRMP